MPPSALSPMQRATRFTLRSLRAIVTAPLVMVEARDHLSSIRRHLAHTDVEVSAMHAAVDRLADEVASMAGSVDPLDERLIDLQREFSQIHPQLNEIGTALRPWRRGLRRAEPNGVHAKSVDPAESTA